MRADSPVVAIVGPTATGKTTLAVALAEQLGNAELVNADSRQVLRGLSVATCAPTGEELRGVTCHLMGLVEPGAAFTVARWLGEARRCLSDLGQRGVQPILVGGTGLYVRALLDGWSPPPVEANPARRGQREATLAVPGGLARLVDELVGRDPTAAERVDLPNGRRVIRALEILDAGIAGEVAGAVRREPSPPSVRIALKLDAAVHERFISDRVRRMVCSGALLEECAGALERGVDDAVLQRSGIGYREGLSLLRGDISPEEAVRSIEQRTRRYAKAQRTWFRGDPAVTWIDWDGENVAALVTRIGELVRTCP